MENRYISHNLEWTDEKVARFWNFRNSFKPYDSTWFTKQAGGALLNFINKKVSLKGKVLDYGTGKGFLVKRILDDFPDLFVYACDFTESLVTETNVQNKNHTKFKGCTYINSLPSVYLENFFDFVFLIETIEHLTDNYLNASLQEIKRILKPGGVVIISTPNEEVLENTYVHCADCGATFHHMQHIRSWSAQSLGAKMNEFSFSQLHNAGVNINWYGSKGIFHLLMDKTKSLFTPHSPRNLIYIGKKLS
ncbi:MAG: class I SAM-dependent methyltransferase [Ferruginibacter sp.]